MKLENKERALNWHLKHITHVEKLVSLTIKTYEPSKEDEHEPMNWKPENWRWLLETYELL